MDEQDNRPQRPPPADHAEPGTLSEADAADENTAGDMTYDPEKLAAAGPRSGPHRRRITSLGDFELAEKIGKGAMGSVYRARQVSKDRPAAVKVLKPHLAEDPLFLQRFMREAEVMSQLRHPNIVRCYKMGCQYGRYYIAMELVEGRTLGDWLSKLGKLSVADALHVTAGVTMALQHAHQNGLVHRDVKPSNILITLDGRIKLADMGLARSVISEDTEATQEGHGAGTPIYVAPEQARDARDADPRSDLYSVGCMLYQMLTGVTPFQGKKALDVILAKIEGKYVPARDRMPELPAELDDMLCRLLAAHPDERYQCATDLLQDLRHWHIAGSLGFVKTDEPAPGEKPPATELDLTSATEGDSELPDERRWYILSLSSSGQWVTQRLTTGQIVEMLRDEQFAHSALASHYRGGFRGRVRLIHTGQGIRQRSGFRGRGIRARHRFRGGRVTGGFRFALRIGGGRFIGGDRRVLRQHFPGLVLERVLIARFRDQRRRCFGGAFVRQRAFRFVRARNREHGERS